MYGRYGIPEECTFKFSIVDDIKPDIMKQQVGVYMCTFVNGMGETSCKRQEHRNKNDPSKVI